MDRKAWTAIILCIAGLGLWQWAYVKYYAPTPEQRKAAAELRAAQQAAKAEAAPTPAATPAQAAAVAPVPAALASTGVCTTTITNSWADFNFVSGAGGLRDIVLRNHLGENGGQVTLNIPEALPIGTMCFEPGAPVGNFVQEPSSSNGDAAYVSAGSGGERIQKIYSVKDSGGESYTVDLEVRISNAGSAPLQRSGFYLATGGAAPVHPGDMPLYTGFDWYRDGKATFIDVNWFSPSKIPLVGIQIRAPQAVYEQKTDKIAWAGVKNQYFATLLAVSGGDPATSVWARRIERMHPGSAQTKVLAIEGALGLPGFTLAPGETRSWRFQIYAGPKNLGILSKLGHGEQEVMNFGMFKWVSEILLYSMNTLYGWIGSYAAAIILLTIIIKALLWPLQNKATNSMRRMSQLSPKMNELREKYKDDPTRMNQEVMKLYKEYGVNPFSGCFPMLIQIPIFFGFYSMLGTAIELRNSSFLWVHDLSQPDTVGHILGFPINILPLLMAGTMIWQMQITPKTGDAAQQRMMMFMPVIFILFAYNFASALSLYWTTQNIISIGQLYLTRNRPVPELEKKSVAQKKALEGSRGKNRKSAG